MTNRNLGELFMNARRYGTVDLFTSSDGTYSCKIEFNTIEHTSLSAHSGFGNMTPEEAVEKASINAAKIVCSFNDLNRELQKFPKNG